MAKPQGQAKEEHSGHDRYADEKQARTSSTSRVVCSCSFSSITTLRWCCVSARVAWSSSFSLFLGANLEKRE